MDRLSLAHANALVGNDPDEAGVEFVLLGGAFAVEEGPLLLAVSGPGATLSVAGERVRPGSAVRAERGQTVSVGDVRGGVYAYMAVAGGVDVRAEMGSRSVHRRSGIGGRPLEAGDALTARSPDAADRPPLSIPTPMRAAGPIRVVPGPQEDEFEPESVRRFYAEEYRVLPNSDRMGCRLGGEALVHRAGFNIVSDGVLPGSVQVPGSGRPLVLMRDCPTTGGYPKIATAIGADLDRIAQTPPGGRLRFVRAEREEAVAAARSYRRTVAQLFDAPAAVRIPSSSDLLGFNLIGGVVDASEGEDAANPSAEAPRKD